MKAVILAGGKGTRLGHAASDIPKPMVKVGDIPILEHQILLLKKYGIREITLITGHLAEIIDSYFKDGERFDVTISYYQEEKPLGTTGGLKEIEDQLTDDFIVLYGDVMVNMNLKKLIDFHYSKKSCCTLVLHPNDHPYDSDLVEINEAGKIIAFHSKPHDPNTYYKNLVNAALYIMSPRVLRYIDKGIKADFGKDTFPRLVDTIELFGYTTAEYLKDVGTPERLAEVNSDFYSGKIDRFNIENKRKAIFIDRDGVINKEVGLLCRLEDFIFLQDTAKAIKEINASEYLAIVITNQPVIARNLCSIERLEEIHKKMESLLGAEHAKLDAVYYCPHHPDKGYPGENPLYKIACNCRKPKPGLIEKAVRDFNIDLQGSFLIGDSWRDILCGKSAGLSTVGVRTGDGCKHSDLEPDYLFENLYEAVRFITCDPYNLYYSKIERLFHERTSKILFIITIGGNSRSGKSVFAKYLEKKFHTKKIKVLTVSLDNWLLPLTMRSNTHNVYDRYQIDKIDETISRLLAGEEIILNKYDPFLRQSSDIIEKLSIYDKDILIIDGVVALSSAFLRTISGSKIFFNINELLLQKRVKNYYRWKGLTDKDINSLFANRKNDEYDIIKMNCMHADIIIEIQEDYT